MYNATMILTYKIHEHKKCPAVLCRTFLCIYFIVVRQNFPRRKI